VSGGTSKLFIDPVLLEEEQRPGDYDCSTEARPHAQIIDLMQALKQSIEKVRREPKVIPAQRKRRGEACPIIKPSAHLL
jgi:hypothetical protein